MSTIYITEPPTKGKVLLRTTLGDVEIELWAKETPKAARNFVQLCLEGYYDNTIFHRVIKNFIAQGDDPTGTGDGGESIYGKPFQDEFHSRIRFNRRGLVAMASSGPDTNLSQFFISLEKTEELQKKHTIFGKIAGDTIFNVLKLNDYEVDENDRPLHPPKILSAEVLWNPFDDIIPREIQRKKETAPAPKEDKPILKKNTALLSFGDDEVDEEASAPRMKSAHLFPSKILEESLQKRKAAGLELEDDIVQASTTRKSKSDSKDTPQRKQPPTKKPRKKLEDDEGEEGEDEAGGSEGEDEDADRDGEGEEDIQDFGEAMRARLMAKRQKYDQKALQALEEKKKKKEEKNDSDDDSDDEEDGDQKGGGKLQVSEEYRRHESRLHFKKSSAVDTEKKRNRGGGAISETALLAQLDMFKKSLKSEPKGEDDDWKAHTLVFAKEVNRIDPMRRGEEKYEIYDPLRGQKEKIANYHQRRLAGKKDNQEKW